MWTVRSGLLRRMDNTIDQLGGGVHLQRRCQRCILSARLQVSISRHCHCHAIEIQRLMVAGVKVIGVGLMFSRYLVLPEWHIYLR